MSKSQNIETQAGRRAKYGTNVILAAVVAVLLVIALNYLAAFSVRNAPRGLKPWLKYDLTETRRYSLSDQTLLVLKTLTDKYRIVTTFRESTEASRQVQALTDQYADSSGQIAVQHLRPGQDLKLTEEFQREMMERFQHVLAPMRNAVEAGRTTLKSVQDKLDAIQRELSKIADNRALPTTDEVDTKKTNEMVLGMRQDRDRVAAELQLAEKYVAYTLPSYTQAQRAMSMSLTTLNARLRLYGEYLRRLKGAIDAARRGEAPGNQTEVGLLGESVRELEASLSELRRTVESALDAVQQPPPVLEYDRLRNQLEDSVIIVGPVQVQVIPGGQLFVSPLGGESGPAPEVRFLVEEKVTGALLSSTMRDPPMVVFVWVGPRSPLKPGGGFTVVADRLRNMNFDVREWTPQQPNPSRERYEDVPPPAPKANQKAVWIVVPPPESRPGQFNPMAQQTMIHQAVEHVRSRLAAGDSAMLMLNPSSQIMNRPSDEAAKLAAEWGIRAELGKLVMYEQTLPEQRRSGAFAIVNEWPTDPKMDLPVTMALGGMQGLFWETCPLALVAPASGKVKVWPLVTLTDSRYWLKEDLGSMQIDRPPDAPGGPLVVAAAAERGKGRVVVTGEARWASDQVVAMVAGGSAMSPEQAAMQRQGITFPANGELFMNSIFWLVGKEDLIAASSRTRDIPRVHHSLNDNQRNMLALWLALGIAVSTTLAGFGMWSIRRKT